MSKSNQFYLVGAAGIVLAAAALVTAYGNAPQPAVAQTVVNGKEAQPLVYERPGFLDAKTKPGADQLVAMRVRTPLELGSWTIGPIGDGKGGDDFLKIDANATQQPHSAPSCIAIRYLPGPTGWAGAYWLGASDDWGRSPGADLRGYHAIVFYARGQAGGERIEFKAGGIDATARPEFKYKDSFAASLGTVSLSRDWQRFSIALDSRDLSQVVGGFAWVATLANNPDGVSFYLDDVRYE